MKTNPIGVRFNEDYLGELKKKKVAKTPQQALIFYENLYAESRSTTLRKPAMKENKPSTKKPEEKTESSKDFISGEEYGKLSKMDQRKWMGKVKW